MKPVHRPIHWSGERSRKTAAWVCLAAFSLQGLSLSAIAAPGLFATRGLGVGREPLSALQFNVPGFGELGHAVNVANGNVFVAFDGLSHNSLFPGEVAGSAPSEKADTLSGTGWNVVNRLRLEGFDSGKSLATYGGTLSLLSGDGSVSTYQVVTTLPAGAPEWITRYQAVPADTVRLYRLQQELGKAYQEEWVVLLATGAETGPQVVAHRYGPSGQRDTFARDGEYADYGQNLYQQYAGAKAQDPEGLLDTTPKTDLTYKAGDGVPPGLIETVKDQWGRGTRYTWDKASQVVTTIESAIPPVDANTIGAAGTGLRTIVLDYETLNDGTQLRPYLKTVTMTARDEPAGPVNTRIMTFGYDPVTLTGGRRFMLKSTTVPVPGGGSVTHGYEYDSAGRVTGYTSKNAGQDDVEPPVSYAYDLSDASRSTVTVTQSGKKQVFTFNGDGQLIRKGELDRNPNDGTAAGRMNVESYEYYPDGNVGLIVQGVEENGATREGQAVHLAYDERGNLTRQALYRARPNGTHTDPVQLELGWVSAEYVKATVQGIAAAGRTFTLKATVTRDPGRQGVKWFLGGTEITGTTPAVALVGEPVIAGAGENYTVTQTFRAAPENRPNNAITAASSADPRATSTFNVTFSAPLQRVDVEMPQFGPGRLTTQTDPYVGSKLLIAPTDRLTGTPCLVRLNVYKAINQYDKSCQASVPVLVKPVPADWYDGPSLLAGTLQVDSASTGRGVTLTQSATYPEQWDLRIPWKSEFVQDEAKTDHLLTFLYQAGTAAPAEALTIKTGYFGLFKAKADQGDGKGVWDLYPREWADYQYNVYAKNSPIAEQRLAWRPGNFTYMNPEQPEGCFNTSYSNGIGWARTSHLEAASDRFPDVKVEADIEVQFKWWEWEHGEGCSPAGTYPGGLVKGEGFDAILAAGGGTLTAQGGTLTAQSTVETGIPAAKSFAQETLTPATAPVTSTGSTTTTLTADLQGGYETYTETAYDAANRPTSVKRVAASDYRHPNFKTAYADVTDAQDYTAETLTAAGQTFRIIRSVSSRHLVGSQLKSTTVTTLNDHGLPLTETLSWKNPDGAARSRQTRTSYWADQVTSLTAYEKLDLSATSAGKVVTSTLLNQYQFGDLPYSEEVLDSAGTVVRKTTFKHNLVGNVVEQVRAGVVVDLPATKNNSNLPNGKTKAPDLDKADLGTAVSVTPTFGDLVTATSYNGFGDQLWSRTKLGAVVTAEKGWSYDDAGGLRTSWTGTPQNLRVNKYDASGRVSEISQGVGSGPATTAATLSTIRQTIKVTFDTFGRMKTSEKSRTGNLARFDTTTFEYDTLDRVVKAILPSGGVTSTWYDRHGEKRKVVTAKQTHVIDRDVLARVTSETFTPADQPENTNTLTYAHDPYGRVVSTTTSNLAINNGEAAQRTAYTDYDSEGNVTTSVGPVLRTNTPAATPWVADQRRTASTTAYDDLGRRVKVDTGVTGVVNLTTGQFANPGTDVVTTTFTYDDLDQATQVMDADGYTTTTTYDGTGAAYRTDRVIWKGTETSDPGVGLTAGQVATVWTLTTPEGLPLKAIDPLGGYTARTYDTAGNVLTEIQQSGTRHIIRKGYTYTPDGLTLATWEPKADKQPETFTLTAASTTSADFDRTALNEYTSGTLPSKVTTTVNDGTAAVSTYEYGWQGKPTRVTAPNGSVTRHDYDDNGNEIRTETDTDVTVTTFDEHDRVRTSEQTSKTPVLTDTGSPLALKGSYVYDAYGNLTRKTENGLTVHYVYNSLGKVIAESKPSLTDKATLYKRTAYRLDGEVMATTTYTYADPSNRFGEAQQLSGGLTASSISLDQQTAGGLQVTTRTPGGLPDTVTSLGYLENENGPTGQRVTEFKKTLVHNGLGLRVLRTFTGDPGIAAQQRDPTTGAFLKDQSNTPLTTYRTYSRYDLMGQLVQQWDEVTSGSGKQKFNQYVYKYTATGKRYYEGRKTDVRVQRFTGGSTRLTADPLLAGSYGLLVSTFNSRDLPTTTTIYESTPGDVGTYVAWVDYPVRVNTFTYYPDGTLKTEDANLPVPGSKPGPLSSIGTKTTTYDVMGRVQRVVDSNGTKVPQYAAPSGGGDSVPTIGTPDGKGGFRITRQVGNGPATTTYAYETAATTVTTSWEGTGAPVNGVPSKACAISTKSEKTLGSYTTVETETDTCAISATTTTTKTHYNSSALPVEVKSEAKSTYHAFRTDANPRNPETKTLSTIKLAYDDSGLTLSTASVSNTRNQGYTYTERTPVYTRIRCTYYADGSEKCLNPVNEDDPVEDHYYIDYYAETTQVEPESNTFITASRANSYTNSGHLVKEVVATSDIITCLPGVALGPNGQCGPTVQTVGNKVKTTQPVQTSATGAGDPAYQALQDKTKNYTTTYVVDAQGNRLSAGGTGLYAGYVKRYNADGNVAMFYRFGSTNELTNSANVPDTQKRASFADFLYDPSGEEVLSATSAFQHNSGGYVVLRNQSSSFSVDGQVQIIRKREGTLSYSSGTQFLWMTLGGGFRDTYKDSRLIRDVTYSLADGLADATDWTAVVLFDTSAAGNTSNVFNAPQLGPNVVLNTTSGSVQAPGQGAPPVVTPGTPPVAPSTPSTASPLQGAAPATPAGTNSTVGAGQTAGTVTTLGTMSGTAVPVQAGSGTNASTSAPSSQPGAGNPGSSSGDRSGAASALQAPQNHLPSAVATATPREVTAPGTAAIPSVPTTGNVNESILPPGKTAIPPVTASTQADGSAIKSPAGVQKPNGSGWSPNSTPAHQGEVGLAGIIVIPTGQLLEEATQEATNLTEAAKRDAANRNMTQDQWEEEFKINLRNKFQAAVTNFVKTNYGKSTAEAVDKTFKFINVAYQGNPGEALYYTFGYVQEFNARARQGNSVLSKFLNATSELSFAALHGSGPSRRIAAAQMIAKLKGFAAKNAGNIPSLMPTREVNGAMVLFSILMGHTPERLKGAYEDSIPLAGNNTLSSPSMSAYESRVNNAYRAKNNQRIAGLADSDAQAITNAVCFTGKNSFGPSTLVRTISGMTAISALAIGTPVLAFNEQLGANGYYPVTAIHRNQDAEITYLQISDPEARHQIDYIETTPEHPFYVTEHSDAQLRPKPEGHEELGDKWVGAGHLRIGDKVKQADGTNGVVSGIVTIQKTQDMYNLTVGEAHTYYVGRDGWLVHNCFSATGRTHILEGEIKVNEGGVRTAEGWHYAPGADPSKVKILKIKRKVNADGVYVAEIAVFDDVTGQWIKKKSSSTFFPDEWDEPRLWAEIQGAFANSTRDPDKAMKWVGVSPSGVTITGYVDDAGNIVTAFPKY